MVFRCVRNDTATRRSVNRPSSIVDEMNTRPSRVTPSTMAWFSVLASSRLAPGGAQRYVTTDRSGSGPTSNPSALTLSRK